MLSLAGKGDEFEVVVPLEVEFYGVDSIAVRMKKNELTELTECPDRPGVFVFKYSMPKHYALEHSSHTIPPEFSVSDLEKAFLKSRWLKIGKERGLL